MRILKHRDTTRTLGEAQGYLPLHIVDKRYADSNTPLMVSYWKPSPQELSQLNAGAAVALTVLGTQHPPVMIGVLPCPEAPEGASVKPPAPPSDAGATAELETEET